MKIRRFRYPLFAGALVLVVSLAGLGFAYAHWTDALLVIGDVETGSVSVIWSGVTSSDRPGADDYGLDPFGNIVMYDKDVGSTFCTIDAVDPHILYYTLTNTYPSYLGDCQAHLLNNGTVPVWIYQLQLIWPTGAAVIPFDEWYDLDYDGDGDYDLNIRVVDGFQQVDPGEREAYSIEVHVKQGAEQSFTYEFALEVGMHNWNEPMGP